MSVLPSVVDTQNVMLSLNKSLRDALRHHKAGEIPEAEAIYRQLLAKFPKNKKAIEGYRNLKVEKPPKGVEIRQIFYNDATRSSINNLFIPLDNTNGKSDWFEFWPIFEFLSNNELKDETWYGFFSPKFENKMGISSKEACNFINKNNDADVILFSTDWDQLTYFVNPWEQGELWHPGITLETQKFCDSVGMEIKIDQLVTSTKSSVFSNFIVAKKRYWDVWLKTAELFFHYSNNIENGLKDRLVKYDASILPMKVFIQERLHALILSRQLFDVRNIKPGKTIPFSLLFEDTPENKKLLTACDEIKQQISEKVSNESLVQEYLKIRSKVKQRKDIH